MNKKVLLPCVIALLAACNDSNDDVVTPTPPPPPPEPTFELNAEIRRTEYGIPHIKADDWKSLGYGFGYAYAQDNYCVTMREIVFASGRSAEFMGEDMGNLGSDFLFRYLNGDKAEFE
ncbi:MAG: penicillin acylase family protein, partial [Halieaceae bacterium]